LTHSGLAAKKDDAAQHSWQKPILVRSNLGVRPCPERYSITSSARSRRWNRQFLNTDPVIRWVKWLITWSDLACGRAPAMGQQRAYDSRLPTIADDYDDVFVVQIVQN
jgi:hypothetical protein